MMQVPVQPCPKGLQNAQGGAMGRGSQLAQGSGPEDACTLYQHLYACLVLV